MKPVVRSLLDPEERLAAIAQLAALRIAVFRDWPYLYDGSIEYESEYLREFAQEPGSVLVVAEDGQRIIGAATASPMATQKAEFRDAAHDQGLEVDRMFYFGESVLLSEYRGIGIGHAFFDAREAAANDAGATAAAFCAVIRPTDHLLRPENPHDLGPFWKSRGYWPVEGMTCSFDWKDVDQQQETAHLMQFWMRNL
jgi:GNAT superfamily N-acetyltransferase